MNIKTGFFGYKKPALMHEGDSMTSTFTLVLSTLFSTLLFTFSASAASKKICFGVGNIKGDHFVVEMTKENVQILSAKGDSAEGFEGTHASSGDVKGRDGITYLTYSLPSDEGGITLLLDSALLDAGTKGSAKLRFTGQGFEQISYFCRDSN